jgi:hypothetical protein
LVTWFEHGGQLSAKKKKRKGEFHNIETDEDDNASEENGPGLPAGGGGDEVNQEVGCKEGENQGEGEAALSKDPPTAIEAMNKRKVSPHKPSTRMKTHASKPQLEAILIEYDISLVQE